MYAELETTWCSLPPRSHVLEGLTAFVIGTVNVPGIIDLLFYAGEQLAAGPGRANAAWGRRGGLPCGSEG